MELDANLDIKLFCEAVGGTVCAKYNINPFKNVF